jgi:hypothetical protein
VRREERVLFVALRDLVPEPAAGALGPPIAAIAGALGPPIAAILDARPPRACDLPDAG